ncbi:MAG: serine hydrolase domain-containing protein [Rubrivivax sp.]|jgi:D-alanyl-D-alanine carboxypeptidase
MRYAVDVPDDLATRLRGAATQFEVPGLAIAMASPGRRALLLHGEAAPGAGGRVTEDTWFSVASLGKHVTAAAVLDLAQRGLVDLSAPINRYLRDLPPAWAGRSVSSLLRHTSGLPEYLAYTGGEVVPEDRRTFMSTYGAMAPAFGESQGWIYTNTNYILSGFLIAQLSGQSYAEAVESLFVRMDCTGAAVSSPQWARDANRQAPKQAGVDQASWKREVIGDGDVSFTPAGALRWLEGLLDQRLLDRTHLDLMFSGAHLATGRTSHYGYGWFLESLQGDVIAHHAGHFDGWTAMAVIHPRKACGVIAMCNLAPGNTRAIRYLAQLALEGFAPGSTPLSLPAKEDDDPALTTVIQSQLLRRPGEALNPACFAEELLRVAEHGSAVRNVINLYTGVEPLAFELVETQREAAFNLRRYRIRYAERIDHVLVGLTPDRRIYWAWPL